MPMCVSRIVLSAIVGEHRSRLACLTALTVLVAVADVRLAQARSPVAEVSHCGFGFGPANSGMSKPGGSLTFMLDSKYRNSHHFIETVGSTTTIEDHDRIHFDDVKPTALKLMRVQDHLVVCIPELRYELVIVAHYCRGAADSAESIPNGEVEEFIFREAGEIWVSDGLFDKTKADPARAEASRYGGFYEGRAVANWRVRPFRDVMPDARKPVTTSCQGLRLPDRP
jgi:hypothetical protein